jgi:2,3,4,5-tetrahydropyridine-2-carboxylate N-succinyltransferase
MSGTALFAFGLGIGTKNGKGEWLEAFFAAPRLAPDRAAFGPLADLVGYTGGNATVALSTAQQRRLAELGDAFAPFEAATRPLVAVLLETDAPLATVPEAYLKLHLLSHRLVKPHGVNLTGVFKILPNVAWTSRGAIDAAELDAARLAARLRGETIDVASIDKFPKLTDYVTPTGVRIADAARVRLGAYLGSGTTVMHEGFVNFNAGCDGPNMVEGRISGGVLVGSGSDLGGGCSTMGTLSGGNDVVISVGKNCLIGANAGLGIPLGDDCTIEAGLYLTAAAKVRVLDRDRKLLGSVKAAQLAGKANLLFRRNSQDGAIECLPNKAAIALNLDLHLNN